MRYGHVPRVSHLHWVFDGYLKGTRASHLFGKGARGGGKGRAMNIDDVLSVAYRMLPPRTLHLCYEYLCFLGRTLLQGGHCKLDIFRTKNYIFTHFYEQNLVPFLLWSPVIYHLSARSVLRMSLGRNNGLQREHNKQQQQHLSATSTPATAVTPG